VLRFALVIAIVPFLLGADSITINTATPNPNNTPQTVKEDGTYTLTDDFASLSGMAKNTKTMQINQIGATVGKDGQGNLTWTATLQVVAGNYDCYGMLGTKDNNGKLTFIASPAINVNVK
jgi:hypothetical protein